MSDIQKEIIKRLPIKSVLRFRSVSKPWNTFITSSHFITDRIQPQRLIAVCNLGDDLVKYFIAIDDDNLCHRKFPPAVPLRCIQESLEVIDCSHGLICLYGYHLNPRPLKRTKLVNLWNPSIRKTVGIILPYPYDHDIIGFGVCPVMNDPTLVNISQDHIRYGQDNFRWKVNVFTLSSGSWKKIVSDNLPLDTVFEQKQVVIDQFIYWFAWEEVIGGKPYIVSFDMCSQEFEVIDLPDRLSYDSLSYGIHLSRLRESLVVLEYKSSPNEVCGVWIMDGVTRSFEKLYSIELVSTSRVRGFRHNGEHIIEDTVPKFTTLKVGERGSQHFEHLGSYELAGFYPYCFVSSYIETLLLLDQEDFHIYL